MEFIASLDKRRIATVVVVLLIALLTGHFTQNFLTDDHTVATIKDGPDAAPVLRRSQEPQPLPVPSAATLTPILGIPPVMRERVQEGDGDRQARALDDCGPVMSLYAAPAATVRVAVGPPCHSGERITLRQGPIDFEGQTDRNGRLEIRIPAFGKTPILELEIAGKTLKKQVEIESAQEFRHVAILWTGAQWMRVHAFEFGARKSQLGHVWSGAPKSPSRASRRSGGYLTKLGDGTGTSAEIYSFPAGHSPLRGVVRLVVEAEVTSANCGREVRAVALQTGPLEHLSETEVELKMPECDRLGDIIRLQNLLQDMRLAGL